MGKVRIVLSEVTYWPEGVELDPDDLSKRVTAAPGDVVTDMTESDATAMALSGIVELVTPAKKKEE